MAHDPNLPAGYEPATPRGDNFLHDYLVAWTGWLEAIGRVAGDRIERSGDLALFDAGSPSPFFNNAFVLSPDAFADVEAFVGRLRRFFGAATGGSFVLWSAWPTPDLRAHGFDLGGHPPLMLRARGGAAPSPPDGLRIEKVVDARGLADYSRAATLGFPVPEMHGQMVWPVEVLDIPEFHVFVGYADGEPVTGATSHATTELQHVEFVATRPEWRGRGFGEAVTWHATLADPAKPAGLVASDDGRPVYERMGYLSLYRFTLWIGSR